MVNRYFSALKQRISTLCANSTRPDVLVLMFHEICPSENAYDSNFSIDFDKFKTLIFQLKSCRKIVKLSDIDVYDCPVAAITFDDVFENIFNEAVPFLIENDLPFELFVCEEFINKRNYIKEETLLAIKDNPLCSISFHSKHHVFVSHLDKKQFLEEISPDSFESKFNLKCQCFAYPFGSFYASHTKYIKEAEQFYKFAFSTINSGFSFNYQAKHKFFLPRINVSNNTFNKVMKKYITKRKDLC